MKEWLRSTPRQTSAAGVGLIAVQQTRGWIALDDIDEAAENAARHGCLSAAARRCLLPPAAAVVFADRSTSAQPCGAVLAGLPAIAAID
jgi:hypothetical protein